MKPFNTINVIPFIDIMLVLLAIVLTTADDGSASDVTIALGSVAPTIVTASVTSRSP